jgi:hypothetical protein
MLSVWPDSLAGEGREQNKNKKGNERKKRTKEGRKKERKVGRKEGRKKGSQKFVEIRQKKEGNLKRGKDVLENKRKSPLYRL